MHCAGSSRGPQETTGRRSYTRTDARNACSTSAGWGLEAPRSNPALPQGHQVAVRSCWLAPGSCRLRVEGDGSFPTDASTSTTPWADLSHHPGGHRASNQGGRRAQRPVNLCAAPGVCGLLTSLGVLRLADASLEPACRHRRRPVSVSFLEGCQP